MRVGGRGLLLAMGLVLTGTSQATLLDRGNGLIYDDVLDITWLQDANLDGLKTWDDAATWADELVYAGYDDWRLPYISVSAGTGPFAGGPVDCSTATEAECRDNELGYMYYQNMAGTFGDNLTGAQTVDGVELANVQFTHWSDTEVVSSFAWGLDFGFGSQFVFDNTSVNWAWAVRSGDSLSVPEPWTGLLLAIGLVGLGVSRRRPKTCRG